MLTIQTALTSVQRSALDVYFFQGLSLHLCHWGALATSLKKRIHVLLVFIAIIPNHLLGQLYTSSPGVEFLRMISKLRKRKKISPPLVHAPFTLSIKLQISKCHVVVVQKRQGNVLKSMLHVQSCFCLIKTIAFLP